MFYGIFYFGESCEINNLPCLEGIYDFVRSSNFMVENGGCSGGIAKSIEVVVGEGMSVNYYAGCIGVP